MQQCVFEMFMDMNLQVDLVVEQKMQIVADTGNLNILFDVITISNPLSALGSCLFNRNEYSSIWTIKKLTVDVWNSWVGAVGINGAYGQQLQELGKVEHKNN